MTNDYVADWVREPQLLERPAADPAGVAAPAGQSLGARVVTAMGKCIVDAQFLPATDDLFFGQRQERGMDAESARAFDARTGRQVGQGFEGPEELRPAVRIAGVVDAVDPEEDVEGI